MPRITKELFDMLEEMELPTGLSIDSDEDNGTYSFIVAADADKKEVKDCLKEAKPKKDIKEIIAN